MRISLLIALAASLAFSQIAPRAAKPRKLVWSDEFNGPATTPPDPAKWNHDLGGGGWGNGEQEVYTDSLRNAFQDGRGHLVIRAIRDASGKYTSARLRTGKTAPTDSANGAWRYGRVEARIQLPFGPGVWPAFWMLGADLQTAGWPTCGEIDILENFGTKFGDKIEDASLVHATLHGPGYSGAKGIGSPFQLPAPQTFTQGFHIFALDWAPDLIDISVDGQSYRKLTPASLPAGARWVFDHPFFILLNLAIGGKSTFIGEPAPETPFPQDMLVDYVRVYAPQR